MDKVSQEKLVKTWIALQRAPYDSEEYHRLFWAHQQLSDLCDESPDKCWEIITQILQEERDDVEILANLAAGPLEDLLVKHGKQIINRVEKEAQTNEDFRKLLGSIWKNKIVDDVWSRLKAVSGPSW